MRIVISETSSGKSYQTELEKGREANIIGKKIGDELDGNLVGAAGYSLQLTGGSDGSGFPMRENVYGAVRKSILSTEGQGFHASEKGERKRVIVRGNVYSVDIVQVNTKVVKAGATKLEELFGKKEEKDAS
ncbi:30S ribosomal protein S6e [Candidatus Micrarchaeota archaeon]|nr:30S ribosomal protein S6e [Candidatus Micrarchaeota archaeon]